MKQFAVLQKIGDCNARIAREFDNYADAVTFATLMQKSEDYGRTEYFVACDIKSVATIIMEGGAK